MNIDNLNWMELRQHHFNGLQDVIKRISVFSHNSDAAQLQETVKQQGLLIETLANIVVMDTDLLKAVLASNKLITEINQGIVEKNQEMTNLSINISENVSKIEKSCKDSLKPSLN